MLAIRSMNFEIFPLDALMISVRRYSELHCSLSESSLPVEINNGSVPVESGRGSSVPFVVAVFVNEFVLLQNTKLKHTSLSNDLLYVGCKPHQSSSFLRPFSCFYSEVLLRPEVDLN